MDTLVDQFFTGLQFVALVGLPLFFGIRSERNNPTVRLSPGQAKFWGRYSGPILFWWGFILAFWLGRYTS